MSKLWPPRRDNVVLFPVSRRERRKLYRQLGVPEPGVGAVRTIVLGAVLVGLVVGMVPWPSDRMASEPGKPSADILWNETAAAPEARSDPSDAQWAERSPGNSEGYPRESAARGRVRFALCHSGGGTNCVVDGDTFYLSGAKVRIAGIDAPETDPPRCAEEARLGAAATERLQALLNAGPVTMTPIDRDRDSYGRLLRNVSVDGADVGDALIGEGLARSYGSGRRSWC